MSEQDRLQKELDDAALKLSSARRAAAAPAATERDKSDLKLIEQEFLALRQKARRGPADGKSQEHPQGHPTNLTEKMDKKLDSALKDSFPGSDPVSFIEATPVKEHDRSLTPVKHNEEQARQKKAKR
jgi:hypothetical protein